MNMSLAVLGMGSGEMVLVFAAILVLFGAKKIPEFAKGLGQGIKEFKKASREVTDELHREIEEPSKYTPPTTPPANTEVAKISSPSSAPESVGASQPSSAPKA